MQEEEEEEWVAKTGRRKKGEGRRRRTWGSRIHYPDADIVSLKVCVCLPGERSCYLLLDEACECACISVFKGCLGREGMEGAR